MNAVNPEKSNNRVDVLFVLTGLTLGGAESQVTELALAHSAAGRRVCVMSMVSNGTLLKSRLESGGVEVVSLGMSRGSPSLVGFLRAVSFVRERRPRIVHAHMFHSNLMARMLRAVSPISVLICTAHNSIEGGGVSMLAYRLTHRLCDAFTNVSELACRELERRGAAPKGSIVPMWNGIDASKYRKDGIRRTLTREALFVGDETFLFLAAGRLTRQKDYPTLLTAMRHVIATRPGTCLAIAGVGESAKELEEMSSSLGLGGAVRWLGERHDVECLMNAADALVLSSEYEGFGLVVAEAMASELPVVATKCNGPEEVLGSVGVLVPIRDPLELSSAMCRVADLSNRDLAAMGAAGRSRVLEKFSLSAVVSKWISLYGTFGVRF
jgi:glycosyltransferase involved in cell wall biosynthesis